MRQRTCLALIGALVLVFVAGCRDRTKRDGLVYWPPPGKWDVELATKLIARWNAENPDNPVEMQALPAGRSSEEVLIAAIVGNTTPCVCSNILTGTVERMVRADALVPLSDFPDFEEVVGARSGPDVLDRFRSSDGKVYQLPYKANPQVWIYNKNMLQEHGVWSAPRTYSEYLDAARKLSKDRDGDGRPDQWIIGLHIDNTWFKRFDDVYPLYIAASGGETLVHGGDIRFEGPAMIGALTFLRELFAHGWAPRSYFSYQLFIRGRSAMTPGSAASLRGIRQKAPDLVYDVMLPPVPDNRPADAPHYTFGDIKSMVIFKSCPDPEASWRLIKFLVSTESDLELMKVTRQFPVRKNLATTEPFAGFLREHHDGEVLLKMARWAERVRGTDDTVHLVEIFDTISVAYETAAVYGLKAPAVAVSEAAARVRRLLTLWED